MELVEPQVDFDHFYAAQFRRVLALAISLSGSRSAGEELTQDAFTEAYRNWSRIGSYDDPGAWVRRVVANRSISRFRRVGREALAMVRLSSASAPTASELDTVDESFWAAVRTLPARQAQVIALRYLDDLSIEEIANVLGISAGAVKSHLHRARTDLAKTFTSSVQPDTTEESP